MTKRRSCNRPTPRLKFVSPASAPRRENPGWRGSADLACQAFGVGSKPRVRHATSGDTNTHHPGSSAATGNLLPKNVFPLCDTCTVRNSSTVAPIFTHPD